MNRDIVILSGVRTAFGAMGGALKGRTATEIAVPTASAALQRAGVSPEDVDHVLSATSEVLRTDTYDRVPIREWGRGRVTLLGDAAHPMTPNLGQGAGQAVEDAWALAEAVCTHDEVEHALRSYEDARRTRANWFVTQSYRMGEMAQLKNRVARAFRNAAIKLTPDSVTERSVRRMYTPSPDPRTSAVSPR